MAALIYIESLGCARNQVDSESMRSQLQAAGWAFTNAAQLAHVIIVNTCSFIEAAADESIDTILALAQNKKKGRCRLLIVCGCLPQRYGRDIVKALPEVDLFLGTGAYDQITAAVSGGMTAGTCLLPDPDAIDVGQAIARIPFSPFSAYLKIAEGCSRRCTYCIIPKLRGRQKSRPASVILKEARHLIAGGARELTLIAQETTAYGSDLPDGTGLADLLTAVAALDDQVWIRFLYGHPESLEPELLSAVKRTSNICPYFDIPIQHASDRVLKRMGRHYGAGDLMRLFENIRAEVDDAVLRTTVLVGFPGETEDDFNLLCELIEKVGFDHLGAFAYSEGEDLASRRLSGHVPSDVARRRVAALMERQCSVSSRRLTRYLGRSLQVLVESREEDGLWSGRTRFQAPEVDGQALVRIPADVPQPHPGDMIDVRVIETTDYDLVAELL